MLSELQLNAVVGLLHYLNEAFDGRGLTVAIGVTDAEDEYIGHIAPGVGPGEVKYGFDAHA